MKISEVLRSGEPEAFLKEITQATSSAAIEALLHRLRIVDENTFKYIEDASQVGWKAGHLHWVPIGLRLGNAGQISLAKRPVAPLAERLINGMEAIIELERQRELARTPDAAEPATPREAVRRYFHIPSLDQVPLEAKQVREKARELARRLTLQLNWNGKAKEFAVLIRDRGIGQSPARMHQTLLALKSDKGEKPYLIGVFGQGGSSTYKASKYSWILSRRAKDLLGTDEDGVGFTVIKHLFPHGTRQNYFAYLAAHEDGRVPYFSVRAAESIGLELGSWFGHIGYDFGQSGAAITRGLYQALNHILYNPVLPFDTDIAGTRATIYGNGYRLSNLAQDRKDLDKTFDPQPIT